MLASDNSHFDIVRTLIEAGANVNAKSNVRNHDDDDDDCCYHNDWLSLW